MLAVRQLRYMAIGVNSTSSGSGMEGGVAMKIIEINVLDGKGLIPVAVCDDIDGIRLQGFCRDVDKQFAQRDELLAALLYVQKQVESGQEIAMSQINAAIRNTRNA